MLRTLALLLVGTAAAQAGVSPDAIFRNGFESPCTGTSNDLPGCVFVPFGQPPSPTALEVAETARWKAVDVYLLIDRSSSMFSELTSLRNNAVSVFNRLACQPLGSGMPGACFESLWRGAGQFAYSDSGAEAYRNVVDVQPAADFQALVTAGPAGSTQEATLLALNSTVTGAGGAACEVDAVPQRTGCPTGRDGYPCFRLDAAPLVVLFSDEAPSANFTCPEWVASVQPEYIARGARVATVYGSGTSLQAITEFSAFAASTGAVDGAGQPLTFSGSDTGAAPALESLLDVFWTGTPIDVHVELTDDPSDAVDTAQFLDHVAAVNDGLDGCPSGALVSDTDGDAVADTFDDVQPGTSVCFRIVVAANVSVPPDAVSRVYPAMLSVVGELGMTIAEVPLLFTVPAE